MIIIKRLQSRIISHYLEASKRKYIIAATLSRIIE